MHYEKNRYKMNPILKTILWVLAGYAVFSILCFLLKWGIEEFVFWWRCRKVRKAKEDGTWEEPKEWSPTHEMRHSGMQLFHLPFTPNPHEVIFYENAPDEAANHFVRNNKKLIQHKLAEKGFSFVYLPDMRIDVEDLLKSLEYCTPSGVDEATKQSVMAMKQEGLPNDYLLQFMVKPKNRSRIHTGFAWYNHCKSPYGVPTYIFDSIEFNGDQALAEPEAVLDEICEELGNNYSWSGGINCVHKPSGADECFNGDCMQLLEEVRKKLDELRLRGISEAVIAQYVKPKVELSRLHITSDLRLFLTDYQNREVVMQPINKAVFLLFLRHEEGINFKTLSDYGRELDIIYQAVKAKHNDIDRRMANLPGKAIANKGIENLMNPLSNAINEKCTRIKEAFLLLMHESTAEHYYVTGKWGENKCITLPRELVIWGDAEVGKEVVDE